MRREWLLLLIAIAACGKREAAPAAGSASTGPAAPAPLAGKPFYRLDVGPQTPCKAGAACEARLVLTALGEYHVNPDYPTKFIGEPGPGLLVEGTSSFALDDAKSGTLVIKFRAARAGTAKLSGTFKLSVCTDDKCEIEQPKIAFELPVG